MPEGSPARIYISGYGLPEINRAALSDEADRLTAYGYDITNADLPPGLPGKTDRLRWSLQMLLSSDLVVQLPGWEINTSARLESSIASSLRMPIVPADFVTDGDALGKLALARQRARSRQPAKPTKRH